MVYCFLHIYTRECAYGPLVKEKKEKPHASLPNLGDK